MSSKISVQNPAEWMQRCWTVLKKPDSILEAVASMKVKNCCGLALPLHHADIAELPACALQHDCQKCRAAEELETKYKRL
mmetsp:Transcript_133367/g.231652  ORF Transcript_133367/g.231652 Transcript_133367/m.231652 type:complete len:80 (-) Transcript_133367:567-806(-)